MLQYVIVIYFNFPCFQLLKNNRHCIDPLTRHIEEEIVRTYITKNLNNSLKFKKCIIRIASRKELFALNRCVNSMKF